MASEIIPDGEADISGFILGDCFVAINACSVYQVFFLLVTLWCVVVIM